MPSNPLADLAALYGVATEYRAAADRLVPVSADTVIDVLAALGVDASSPQAVTAALEAHRAAAADRLLPPSLTIRAGRPTALPVPEGTTLRVELEDGRTRPVPPDAPLPGDLPLGYHTLHAAFHGTTCAAPLAVTPRTLPPPPRAYGLLVQLYSLLSHRSWGMGDLGDLAALATWAGGQDAGFIQVNPLHAANPVPPADPSPYSPATRAFPDPVYLAVDRIPEAAALSGDPRARFEELARDAAGYRHAVLAPHRADDALHLINRDAVWRLKRQALDLLFPVPRDVPRERSYRAYLAEADQHGRLTDHATWCALAESDAVPGSDFRTWPEGLRDPASAQTAAFRRDHPDRVEFHRWLAWLTDCQLADAQRAAVRAGMPLGLVHDLAIGAHPAGSDAWALSHSLARGIAVGSPPDAFNPHGQNWGLPPWRPDALAATGHAAFRDLLRSVLRHAGGIRVDHVMGLFRLWWIPEGRPPTEGTYVRYDAEAMIGVLALEAHRAGAAVVGEDLGTVEPHVRRELAERGVLGTSVLWFERGWTDPVPRPVPPEQWRESCLATLTTHDLPSTAARLTGEHVALRHRLGLLSGQLEAEQRADREDREEWLAVLVELGLLPKGEVREEQVVAALHRFLRRTPARLTGVWLPDGLGDRRPQNLPGTVDEYPNWRLPLADARGRPVPLEELVRHPRVAALLDAVRRG